MDPFSAATGVAGLISLGIEVCKGLNAYCRDYRSKDSEILSLSQQAKRLEAFLHMIEGRMKGKSQVDQALATTFEDCYATCTICLQEFAALNTKYARPKAVSGFTKQGKAFIQQLQFPFHKAKLDGLSLQMHEFQNALSHCLLLLNYDRTSEVLNATVSEAAKISSAIIWQGQRTTDQLSFLLPQIDKSIHDRLSRLERFVLAHPDRMQTQIAGPVIKGLKTFPVDDRDDSSSDGNTTDDRRQIDESSASEIDPGVESQFRRPQQLHMAKSSIHPNFGCNCKFRTAEAPPGSRSSVSLSHTRGCPLEFLDKRSRIISGEIRIFSTLLLWKVSIRYSQSFLRDLEVQPNFTMTAIVPRDSPAFRLIASLYELDIKMTDDQVGEKISATLRGLRQLFTDHKAWPTDVSMGDINLLHRACCVVKVWVHANFKTHFVIPLLAALVSMGVPINGDGHCGTPLRWLLSYGDFEQTPSMLKRPVDYAEYSERLSLVARELMLRGAIYSEKLDNYRGTRFHGSWALPGLFPSLGDVFHYFDYGELSSALIRRSEADVRQLLGQSVKYVFEKGHHDQTPLHVSIFWPPGLTVLFEMANEACASIIDAKDASGLTALQCAIYWPQVESVAFLMKQNATIHLEVPSTYVPYRTFDRTGIQHREVSNLLAAILVGHRTEMLQFAVENLPESEVVRLGLQNMTFLKETAFEVVESLKSLAVRLPEFYDHVVPGSIYHCPMMDDTLAKALFEAGFDSTDASYHGYTPLMIQTYDDLSHAVKLISWFLQKQADYLAVIPLTSLLPSTVPPPGAVQFRVIHRLASILGDRTARKYKWSKDDYLSGVHSQYLILMRKILSESTLRDPCRCHCAPEGCNSASLYTKALAKFIIQSPPRKDQMSGEWDIILEVMSEETECIQAAFLRGCTFNRLGMRHACCAHDPSPFGFVGLPSTVRIMDCVEVEEIQEEDIFLAETLEELMIEVQSQLRNRSQTFRDCWEWWNKRMNETDKEQTCMPVEDLEAIFDIGVRLEN